MQKSQLTALQCTDVEYLPPWYLSWCAFCGLKRGTSEQALSAQWSQGRGARLGADLFSAKRTLLVPADFAILLIIIIEYIAFVLD